MARVLLVANDQIGGSEIADTLEEAGHEVMWCPGPQAPTYVCQGGRGCTCPLTGAADVVVVDGWLASDAKRCGTPSWHLVRYYRSLGLPVVFLVGPDGLPGRVLDPGVQAIPRDARAVLVEWAVREAPLKSAVGRSA